MVGIGDQNLQFNPVFEPEAKVPEIGLYPPSIGVVVFSNLKYAEFHSG
jgi:hypothetical protein